MLLGIGVKDLLGEQDIETTTAHLSDLAQAIVQVLVEIIWSDIVGNEPDADLPAAAEKSGFAVLALGKLGGRETHYQSDLDVIFVHNSTADQQITQGPKCIDNSMYFARLAQKIISMAMQRSMRATSRATSGLL